MPLEFSFRRKILIFFHVWNQLSHTIYRALHPFPGSAQPEVPHDFFPVSSSHEWAGVTLDFGSVAGVSLLLLPWCLLGWLKFEVYSNSAMSLISGRSRSPTVGDWKVLGVLPTLSLCCPLSMVGDRLVKMITFLWRFWNHSELIYQSGKNWPFPDLSFLSFFFSFSVFFYILVS